MSKLYVKDSPKSKKLLLFLRRNIKTINSKGLRLMLEVAAVKKAKYYDDNGIYGFPALVHEKEVIVGDQEIIDYLTTYIGGKPAAKTSRAALSEDDDFVDDWLVHEATHDDNGQRIDLSQKKLFGLTDDDDTENVEKTLKDQMQKAINERMKNPAYAASAKIVQNIEKNTIKRPSNIEPRSSIAQTHTPATTHASAAPQESDDDKLMANMLNVDL